MLNTRTESKTEMENNLKDNASALVEGHVLIKDTDTGEVLLNKHNAINFTNMALAMARVLGGEVDSESGLSYVIKKMAFGNGGTLIDGTGTIEYRSNPLEHLDAPAPGGVARCGMRYAAFDGGERYAHRREPRGKAACLTRRRCACASRGRGSPAPPRRA